MLSIVAKLASSGLTLALRLLYFWIAHEQTGNISVKWTHGLVIGRIFMRGVMRLILLLIIGTSLFDGQAQSFSIDDFEPISIVNASEIVELYRIGNGIIRDIVWVEPHDQIYVQTSIGVWKYDAETLDLIEFLEFPIDEKTTIGETQIGNIETGRQVAQLSGQNGDVLALSFSPDNASLVSIGTDRTIRLWDIATGVEEAIAEISGSNVPINSVNLSPDNILYYST